MHKTFFIATVLLASVLSGPSPAQTNSATEIEFWRSISNSTDSAEFEAYLKAYPSGQFTDLAKIRLSKLKPASPPDNTTASGATESGKIANDASLQSMNDRIRREPKNSDILNDRGNWYFKNKDFDKAIADYTKVVEIKPDSFAGFFNRGLAYQEKSEHLRAAADFSRAIERKSEEAVAWSSRGWSRFMADDTTGAITDFTKALELDRNNTGTRLNRGKAYTKQGDYVRALADYDRVIEVAPQSAHAHEMRGWTLVAVGRYEDGQRDLAKVASLGQPAYGIIHGFGCVDGWKKRIFAETIANCTALSFIDDRTLNTIRRRDALLSIGEYERAATAQRQIAPMMATDSYLRDDSREGTVEDRGLAALETGRLEYAKWIFATNNKQYSQDARSRVGLALVHLAENNPKAAIELLNEVMGFKGDQLGTLMVRGRAHMANKSPLDAVIDFSAVIEARPNDVEARVARGSAHLAGGATDKAKLDAQHAMNLNPRLAGIYELRAGIAEAEGDKELAVEQLGEALLRHRNSLSALKSRARLLTSLGQVQSARRDESQVEQLSHDLELALRASRRPWFGIIFYDVNAGEAKDVKGAVVKSQYEGPASHAGLEQGDVITSLDGRQIASGTEFATHATTLEIGKSVRITYTRNGVENDALIAPASSDYERCNNRSDWAHVREACTISLKNDGLDTKTRSSALANRGGSFHEANMYAPAIADLTAAIELNPKNLGAVHKRGNAKAKSGDHIGAIVDFDTDIMALPNDQYAFADRGDSYRRLGQCETAISDFEAALKHEGSEGMSYSKKGFFVGKGLSHMCLGDYALAVDALRKDKDGDQYDAWAHRLSGADHFKRKDYVAANTDFKSAAVSPFGKAIDGIARAWAFADQNKADAAIDALNVSRVPDWVDALLRHHRALILDFTGRKSTATTAYDALASADGFNNHYAVAYIRSALHSGNVQRAEAMIKRVIETRADGGGTFAELTTEMAAGKPVALSVRSPVDALADALVVVAENLGEGDPLAAQMAAHIALYLRPTLTAAMVALSENYTRFKRHDLALRTLEGVTTVAWQPTLALKKATIVGALGRLDEARQILDALAREPGQSRGALIALQALMFDNGRYEDSVAALTHIIESLKAPEKSDWWLWYRRALAFDKLNRFESAETDLLQSIKLDNAQVNSLNTLGYFYADKGVKLDEAKVLLERALKFAPADGNIVDSLGWVAYRQGRYADAVTTLERATKLSAGSPILLDHLARAYWRVDMKQKAHETWRAALNSKPDRDLDFKIQQYLSQGLRDSD